MVIFKTMDGLFKGTRYGVLGLSVLGIVGSVVLLFMNISLGLASTAIFLASLIGSLGLVLLLVPRLLIGKYVAMENIVSKRYIFGSVLVVVAFVIVGLAYLSAGGFPPLNIPFPNI